MPRSDPSACPPLSVAISSLMGLVTGLALSRIFPLVPSTVLSTLVLAGGANLGQRLRRSSHWWGLVGFSAGSLVGTGWVLSLVLKEKHPSAALGIRALVVLLMVCGGAIAGHGLGGFSSRADPGGSEGGVPDRGKSPPLALRRPADVLKSAGGLTAGSFAALVTLTYVHSGLDGARAFSSRLSTSLTIFVICLAGPGWLSHQWRQHRLLRSRPLAHTIGNHHAPR